MADPMRSVPAHFAYGFSVLQASSDCSNTFKVQSHNGDDQTAAFVSTLFGVQILDHLNLDVEILNQNRL
jgi:hypothetical protein